MKTTEITTAQNVTIEYEFASIVHRGIAFLLDLIILSFSYSILTAVVTFIFGNISDIVSYVTTIPILFFYSLFLEYFNNGQSLGKMALKIKVVKIDGEKTTFLDYAMRWIFRGVDIYGSFGVIAVLGILTSSKRQRLGDFLANTIVVRTDKQERMQLQNLLKLNQLTNYEPSYPEVVNMNEASMLVVKETIDRYSKNSNYAHEQALMLLVKKMEVELNITSSENPILFLKTLLKDYVVLTR